MNYSKLALLALPLLAACSPQSTEPASATQEMTSSWFAANLPAGSPAEAGVLALVNDPTMSMASFVSRCGFSESQAAAIVSYRAGDEPGTSSDDQRFDSLSELDALPFTDAGFWAAAKTCSAGSPPLPVCVPPPLVIELVVDESGSMDAEGKWDATRDALLALVQRLSTTAGANVQLGALRFGSSVARKVAPRAIRNQDQVDALVDVLDTPTAGGGGTETNKALEAAYAIVERATTTPGSRGIVVLLSDGSPSGGDTEKANVLRLVAAERATGVTTYSVGIGQFPTASVNTYDPVFMGRIAMDGGTAPAGCNPLATTVANVCHHQITPGEGSEMKNDLLTAFLSISASATAASSCP